MLLRVKSTLYILDLNQLLDIGFKTFPPLRGLPCYSADRALCCSTAFNFREVRSVCFSLLACAFGAAHEKSLPGQHREALPRVSSQERCGLSQEFKETPSGAHAFLHVAPWESASPPGASVAPLAAGPGPGGEGPSRGVGELALCLLWARHSRHHEEPSVSPPPATRTRERGPVRPPWLLLLGASARAPGAVPTRLRCPAAWVSVLGKGERVTGTAGAGTLAEDAPCWVSRCGECPAGDSLAPSVCSGCPEPVHLALSTLQDKTVNAHGLFVELAPDSGSGVGGQGPGPGWGALFVDSCCEWNL